MKGRNRTDPGAERQIEVECLSCGRVSSFSGDDARVRGTPLVELTRRFRCSQCGSRAVRAKAHSPRDIAQRMRSRMDRGCDPS